MWKGACLFKVLISHQWISFFLFYFWCNKMCLKSKFPKFKESWRMIWSYLMINLYHQQKKKNSSCSYVTELLWYQIENNPSTLPEGCYRDDVTMTSGEATTKETGIENFLSCIIQRTTKYLMPSLNHRQWNKKTLET